MHENHSQYLTPDPRSDLDLIGSDAFLAGYTSGYLAGLDRGREREAAERDALHRRAYEVVQAMSRIEPRDAQADAERADRREQWWAERRGEGAA